jgi:hypothetical protein
MIGAGAHPASYPVGIGDFNLEVKRQGSEAGHSHPTSTEIKNAWSSISTPPVRLHGVVFS